MANSPMKIYLAARYGRREEIDHYAQGVREQGWIVVSTWHTDEAAAAVSPLVDFARDSVPSPESREVAIRDTAELESADVVIAFTERADSPYGRGARHVEAGMAMALGKHLICVGHLENVFYAMPGVEQASTWGFGVYAILQSLQLKKGAQPDD